jgi:protein-S-isoprenylcysteine O-methyltransferase Ste14
MIEVAIRALALYVPMLLLFGAARLRRPTRRERSAAILACIWNIPALLIVHVLARQAGWWTIPVHGGALVLGMPIELLAGWMLLWGALPVIVAPRVPLVVIVGAALALDLWAMPRCAPVVMLGSGWLIGEGVALLLCLVPAQLIARWTRDERHLGARATLQVICFAALALWLVPAAVFDRVSGGAGGWRVLSSYDTQWFQVALQLVALAALPGVSAVQEFVRRGEGTPVPFDPPHRLVTTGIYAYVANPMQLSAVLTLLAWGALLRNGWVAGASAMVVIYGAGFAAWDERRDLAARFGDRWMAYRHEVHDWFPRWRPSVGGEEEARLYVAFTCGKCSEVGAWVQRQRPRGLRIVPAEQYPSHDLWRITYVHGDSEDTGVAALARALEHMHLGWALAGMFVRLPLIRPCVQAIVDVSGGGPQRIARVALPDQADPAGQVGQVDRMNQCRW